MMKPIRRVVTGASETDRAMIASDSLVNGIEVAVAPGAIFHPLWGSDNKPHLPDTGDKPEYRTWFPPDGGFRFVVVTLPPDAEAAPPDTSGMTAAEAQAAMAAGLAEAEAKLPGLLSTFEAENPAFHRSDTVDMLYILSGTPVLDLDDGRTVTLQPGDTVVQNGVRHAWRNPGSEPVVMVGMIVGAQRSR
jgi:mannose-6-phosphate isomerase-like protein (cupin superfamily)